MKYIFTLVIFSFFGCASQVVKSAKIPIEFEDSYHYPYNLISNKFQIIETQEQINGVFRIIHQKNGGKRLSPIPTVNDEESYFIFKPLLKKTNDIEIKEIYTENNTLYVILKEFDNPQIEKSSRLTPNVLVKLLKKVSCKKLVINYATQ
jgi:hypothetical protein